MNRKNLILVVILGLPVSNVFGTDQSSPSLGMVITKIIMETGGKNCDQQAALNAYNCLKNTCIGQGSVPTDDTIMDNIASQGNCYNQYCGGLSCPISPQEFAQNFTLSSILAQNLACSMYESFDPKTGKKTCSQSCDGGVTITQVKC